MVDIQIGAEVVGEAEVGDIVVCSLDCIFSPFFFDDDDEFIRLSVCCSKD